LVTVARELVLLLSQSFQVKEDDDKYIVLFLLSYLDAVKRRETGKALVDSINAIKLHENHQDSIRLEVMLRRVFQSEEWHIFFENVFSRCSLELVFGDLSHESTYSKKDLRPQFLPEMIEKEVELTPLRQLPRVRRRREIKPVKKKQEKALPASTPVQQAPNLSDPEQWDRFQRLELWYRREVPDSSGGELPQDFLLAVGLPNQTSFSAEIIRGWINSGENKQVEQFLTDAGF